jgi:hypothetical protein
MKETRGKKSRDTVPLIRYAPKPLRGMPYLLSLTLVLPFKLFLI